VLRILVEKKLDLDLRDCLELAAAQFAPGVIATGTTDKVFDYMIERFRAWFEEESIPAEVFKAVSARNLSRPLDIQRRVYAVHAFTALAEAPALTAANKRVSNILEKLDAAHPFGAIDEGLLSEAPERELASQLAALTAVAQGHLEREQYTDALACLAGLRGPVDAFFDGVMVNADDAAQRNNRLNLL